MKRKLFWILSATWLLPLVVAADVLVLKNGKVFDGIALQTNSAEIVFQLDYGTLRFPISTVRKITSNREAKAEPSELRSYLPPWNQIVAALAKQSWAVEFKQIPATVIDNGNLKNVPYMSFHCGH